MRPDQHNPNDQDNPKASVLTAIREAAAERLFLILSLFAGVLLLVFGLMGMQPDRGSEPDQSIEITRTPEQPGSLQVAIKLPHAWDTLAELDDKFDRIENHGGAGSIRMLEVPPDTSHLRLSLRVAGVDVRTGDLKLIELVGGTAHSRVVLWDDVWTLSELWDSREGTQIEFQTGDVLKINDRDNGRTKFTITVIDPRLVYIPQSLGSYTFHRKQANGGMSKGVAAERRDRRLTIPSETMLGESALRFRDELTGAELHSGSGAIATVPGSQEPRAFLWLENDEDAIPYYPLRVTGDEAAEYMSGNHEIRLRPVALPLRVRLVPPSRRSGSDQTPWDSASPDPPLDVSIGVSGPISWDREQSRLHLLDPRLASADAINQAGIHFTVSGYDTESLWLADMASQVSQNVHSGVIERGLRPTSSSIAVIWPAAKAFRDTLVEIGRRTPLEPTAAGTDLSHAAEEIPESIHEPATVGDAPPLAETGTTRTQPAPGTGADAGDPTDTRRDPGASIPPLDPSWQPALSTAFALELLDSLKWSLDRSTGLSDGGWTYADTEVYQFDDAGISPMELKREEEFDYKEIVAPEPHYALRPAREGAWRSIFMNGADFGGHPIIVAFVPDTLFPAEEPPALDRSATRHAHAVVLKTGAWGEDRYAESVIHKVMNLYDGHTLVDLDELVASIHEQRRAADPEGQFPREFQATRAVARDLSLEIVRDIEHALRNRRGD